MTSDWVLTLLDVLNSKIYLTYFSWVGLPNITNSICDFYLGQSSKYCTRYSQFSNQYIASKFSNQWNASLFSNEGIRKEILKLPLDCFVQFFDVQNSVFTILLQLQFSRPKSLPNRHCRRLLFFAYTLFVFLYLYFRSRCPLSRLFVFSSGSGEDTTTAFLFYFDGNSCFK